MTLRDNIDTNKNNRIDISSQCNEINNFILDKNKGEENLNELGKHLNNLDTWKLDNLGIKDALQSYFGAPERTELNKKIKGKINKNEPLTNKELSLLYLEMITNKNNKLTEQKLKFDSKQPIEKICGGALISYIRTKYNFPTYTGKKVKIDLPNQQHTRKPSTNPINRMKESQKIGGNINLPENIGEIKESEADFYCNRLITWAEQNFPNEIDKAKRQLQIRHKYKDESIEQAYIKYDTLLIAFNKYCEIVSKNHTKLITSPEIGYKDDEDFKQQMNQIEYFESEISRRYPGIDKILEIVKKFHEEIEKNKKKFFGEDKDGTKLKKAENDYKCFNDFIQSKYKEYDIKKVEQSLKKTPNSGDETVEYFLNYNKITKFQNEINQKRLSYGDSIKKYTSYTENLKSIHDKYNLEQYEDTLSKYHYDVQRLSHGIDFAKFQKYTNKIKYETSLQNGMKNVSLLGNLLMDKTNKYFPFKEIRDAEIQKQVKQNETDKWRDDLKNNSPRIHWLLTGLSGLYNGLVDFTIGTSSSLGVLILGLIGGEDETLAQMDHKEEFDNRFKINISSSQTEEVYNSETGEFNFNLDNTTYTVASSISQMLGLIYGGGAIGKGATKAFQIGENVAGKIGLFSSSFITQIGGSYQEAVRGGLSGGEALGYSMLSATMQSGLELISPNEVLLGKGSGITKELIRNACKSGSKESIRMVGKIFTRNVWNEIREENIQEALQTVAGNLVNMATDGAFGSEIGADWSRKNFASTAVITTLTTGITTGTSTGRQMSQLNSSDRTKLIDYIKSDNGTYSDVIEMINDGITGTIKIPNVDIQQLQELKGLLTSSTGNTNTGNLNGGTINTEIIPDDVEVVAVDDDVEVVAVDDDVEVVAVDDQNIEIGDPKEIRRVANIFSEFADFNVDEYVDSHANIALYGRDEQYIRDVLGFLKEYDKNDKDKNDKTKQDPSCFSYFQNARVVDYILSNSKLKIENMKNLLKDEKINIKDIEYAIKQNNELSESEIKEEIKKFNILLNIKSEEDLQKYITGKKIGSDISGNLEEYINENGLCENSEQIENWYYGNFNPETQKFTMARDIGNSEFDIKLIQNIINQQNITPRGLEHNSPYALLKELHENDYESFRLYSEYLLGKNVTSLAGEYSVGSFGQDNRDPALYWHTRVGKDSFIGGAKYRIIGEFNPGEIVRSGELNQVADQTANWPESERVTIGEVSNNNVKQIIDLETGKVIYDRDSGFADLSLSENNQSKKANLEEKYSIDLPKEGENLPQILGSRFHEERRQSRLQSDGTYAPRVEKTSDQTWISEHNGQTEVDIANTPFEDLPSDWQSENLEAAKLALGLVYNKVKNGENITPEMIEEMSEIVHNKRLERNGIEGSFENQRVPYEQLSEIEKEKDKNQILRAIETVEQGNNDHFNGSSQQSEITKAETNETNDKNIDLLQELGIEVNLYSIEVTKNLTEEEINTIRDINKLITIDVWGIQLIKESKLTKDNINTIEKLKNMGFEITIYDIERIKGLTKSDIINIGKLKNTGLEITIYDVEKIKGLTDNDINTIEKLKNMGFEISISSIEGIKGLTDSDISHIEKLKNMGFEIKTHKIEKIKGLTDSDISHIEKLKNIGISQLNLNDIEIIRSITENDINKIKKLYNILNNLGIKISIYNIERIRLMTDENVREFELKQDDIIKIKLLKNLGVEINIEDIENVRLLKQDDIDKIERINNLGIKINVLGGLYFLSIELINSLTEEDISKMEQLRFSELLPNEISQDDIEIIRSLTNDEITYLKSIKSDTKNIQDIISFKDYNIILNIAPIKDKRNYIKRKNEYLKNNETLSNEQFNALFKPNTDEYKFQQTQNEDFGTGKYGISDINQTDLGYCYAYTTFELLKKSNFFEVLVRTSMKETNNGREIKLPLGDPNGETIKVNKTEIDQEYLIGENRKVNINSNSALGIKILEIAFIKKSIIQNNYIHQLAKTNKLQPIILKAQEEFKETGDITITGELLEYLESGITSDAMETIINNDLLSNLPITEKEKKIAIIKYINQGNIKIGISRDKDTGDFTVHPKIIENNKNKEKGPDLKYNILCGHAYSIERTYYDESINENLIVFINPHNTSEKIHITIDECINIFPKRDITTININKIFNKNGEIKAENQDNNTGFYGKQSEIINDNKTNVEHLEELGIKIPEVSKERFNKMNLDFEVVKGLKELLIDVSSYIIDASQFIKFDTAKLKHFQELGIKINEGNINSLNEANLNNKGIINFRELQKIGIQVYEPEILNGTEFNFQKLGQLEELGININKDNIIELNKSEINFQILKRLENIGIKLSDEDIIGISSDKIEINIDKLEQLKEIGVNINEDNIGELNEAKFNINKLKQLKEIGVNINEDNIGELNEAKFNIDKLEQLKEIGIDINEDNVIELNGTDFNFDKLRYLKEIGININEKNITKLNKINNENILMLKKIGDEKVQLIIKHKGLDVTGKPEWFIKHINVFTIPDVMARVTELNKMGIIISNNNNNLLIPKNFKKIKQFSELGIDVSKDTELCLNTEITQDIIKRLNTLKGFGISPIRLKTINRINNLENSGIETNDILSQEYIVNYKEYGIKEDEIKANLQYKKGQIIEEIQQYIQNTISKKENIGETEIINRIRTNLMILPKTERLNLLTTISEVVEKSNNIRKYIDFENGPYKDKYPNAKTLLCAIRGITEPNIIDKITDDITVIQHGAGLNFFIGDVKSYYIIRDNSLNSKIGSSGGFNTTESNIKELEGTLSVLNGKNPGKDTSQFEYEAIWHEGQHNRNSYFMPDKDKSRIAYSKDEILAYSRDGTSIEEIEETLTTPENKGGLYQYNLKGKERENHKRQIKELLGFASELFELANNSKTGLTKDKVISMLSDTPANERKNLHATITDALKIHIERSTNQTNFDQSKIKELKERFINKVKERAGNNKLINNLLDFWNSTFSEYKINPEELWWAGTTKKETVVNEIESCNSIDEIKHILNNPKYSHIGRGENNKGGIEISAIIDEVVAGRVESDILPLEIRSKIEGLIKK